MTRWTKNGRLSLGPRMGWLVVWVNAEGEWNWEWRDPGEMPLATSVAKQTEAAAKRSAISWLRRALQQAGKRVEG